MKAPHKFLLSLTCGVGIAISAIVVVALWFGAGQLVHPERRAIQDYQRDWLDHPEAHGIHLRNAGCDGGRVPCLLVAPDSDRGPAKRGSILRGQLAALGGKLLPYGQTRGILVLLHGRKGRKEDLLPVAERFAAAGFKAVIPDLPGHGDSPVGQVRFGADESERNMAGQVLEDARRFFQEPESPAGVWGMSMGGAFAISAASLAPDRWRAIVVVSTFDSLQGVVDDRFRLLPPRVSHWLGAVVAGMTEHRGGACLAQVRPDNWAKQVPLPVFVAHGDRDQLIPLHRGRRLFDAFSSGEKVWTVVPGADHDNILVTEMPLYARMSTWLIAHFE